MKIYLAGRYERRLELVNIAKELKQFGHEITSRWLDGSHDNAPRQECALVDIEDIINADGILLITENQGATRGGRHFEFGYAYALGKTCIILGEPENVFHYLPEVEVFAELKDVLLFLKAS